MDKPISLSVKDYLIRKMAVKMMVPESIVDAVITHQFSSANKAVSKHNSLEISGFGKFFFNEKKAKTKMVNIEEVLSKNNFTANDPNCPESVRQRARTNIEKLTPLYEQLKRKTNA